MKKPKHLEALLAGSVAVAVLAAGFFLVRAFSTSVEMNDHLAGMGLAAEPGHTVVFHYTGYLSDPRKPAGLGPKFDSTYDRHEPISLKLGRGQMIPGLEVALQGLKPGARRKAVIPARLAYGSTGAGDGLVPPNADLVYEIEVRDVRAEL